MKKTGFIIVALLFGTFSRAQTGNYWQQQVDYDITVSLDDSAKTLDGYEKLVYHNNSPDTLSFIWFHIWPNAYKNDRTAFSEQMLKNGNTAFYFSNEEQKGYINRLDFKVDKTTATVQDHPLHQDIIKLILPKKLFPGDSILIETPFHEKLPYNFSRGGYIGKSFQVTQWYPKPAVYDLKGWHEMPYLDQGEFYSEFGNYSVRIQLPRDYVVAATGKLAAKQDMDDQQQLLFQQARVHDFAWFADKQFETLHDSVQIDGHNVDVYAYFHKENREAWKNSTQYIKDAALSKSALVGSYPYDIISVVEKPAAGNGGMEYPTICLLDKPSNAGMLQDLIRHEVGHNWFYGILASNEREFPWMDEGMNTYYDQRQELMRTQPVGAIHSNMPRRSFMQDHMPADIIDVFIATQVALKKDQPISTDAALFSEMNYNLIAYYKTAQWMNELEKRLGRPRFDTVMHEYFDQYKFKHPQPENFMQVVLSHSGAGTEPLFSLLGKKGAINPTQKKQLKFSPIFNLKETDKYNYIFFAPAIGYNYYDKLMLGGIIHNYGLPPQRLQFFVAPLYATGSKQFNGMGRISYTLFPASNDQKIEFAVAGARFTADNFVDSTGKKNAQPFYKIVPSIKYVFGRKDPRSLSTSFIQWKTFFINETGLSFSRDTIQQQDIISYPRENRFVNQLRFVTENHRVLYPYAAELMAEQGKHFARVSFTGNYFLNYANGGGLKARLFAGKFFYTTDHTFFTSYETDRYQLNMTGPKGYEDYTYSNYFIGRNEYEGLSNQQIMTRDGAFKMRTDLLNSKIGKSDDWLAAINLSTSIPKQVNPLELLPIKIPLRLFCDFGSYALPWKQNSREDRFLYEAGFQLSLFHDVLNIYCPVVYSKVYRDYVKSTITEKKFLKSISFSIDIQNFSIRDIIAKSL